MAHMLKAMLLGIVIFSAILCEQLRYTCVRLDKKIYRRYS